MGEPLMTSLTGILISESLAETTLFKVSDIGRIGNFDTRDKLTRLCLTARVFEALKDQNSLDVYRLFCIWSAERVRHLLTDSRSIKALDVCREYIAGNVSSEVFRSHYDQAYAAYFSSQEKSGRGFGRLSLKQYAMGAVAFCSSAQMRVPPLNCSVAEHGLSTVTYSVSASVTETHTASDEQVAQLAKLMELLDAGV